MYSSLMITKSPTFTTLVSMVLFITHVLILVLLILWSYITFVIRPSKSLDYPVTLSMNNTLRWGVALVNPVDVTISSFTDFILPNREISAKGNNLYPGDQFLYQSLTLSTKGSHCSTKVVALPTLDLIMTWPHVRWWAICVQYSDDIQGSLIVTLH